MQSIRFWVCNSPVTIEHIQEYTGKYCCGTSIISFYIFFMFYIFIMVMFRFKRWSRIAACADDIQNGLYNMSEELEYLGLLSWTWLCTFVFEHWHASVNRSVFKSWNIALWYVFKLKWCVMQILCTDMTQVQNISFMSGRPYLFCSLLYESCFALMNSCCITKSITNIATASRRMIPLS